MKKTNDSWRALSAVCIGAVAMTALASACYVPEEQNEIGEISQEIDLSNCGPAITCPKPKDCGRKWSDKPRDPAWGPCAPPPDGCTQVVFGRFDDTKKYLGCPGYITLNLKAWTQQKNDEFVGCAFAGELGGTCKPEILIASTNANIPDTGSVCSTELCQLNACKCTVLVSATGTGSVKDCPRAPKKKPATKQKKSTTCGLPMNEAAFASTTTTQECVESWACEACDPESDVDCEYDVGCGCESCELDDMDPACSEDLVCPGDEVLIEPQTSPAAPAPAA